MKRINIILTLLVVIGISISCKKGESATSRGPNPTPTDNEKNDLVFVTGNTYNSGNVYALSAKDGSIIWNTSLYTNTSYYGIHSSLTLVNGTLYLGCPPNRVIALDAKTGNIKWDRILQSGSANFVFSSPLVINNSLFIGQGTKFYCIDAITGTFKWIYTQAGVTFPNEFESSSPCYYNNVVYLNGVNGGSDGLFGFDETTGAVRLSGYIPSQKYGTTVSPCISNDTIYSTFSNNASGSGSVFRYKVSNNTSVPGNFFIPQTGPSSPTIFNGYLFIGSANYLYAYNTSPNNPNPLKWLFQCTSGIGSSSPAADSNSIYIGTEDRILYSVNRSDGSKKWEFQAPVSQISGPSISPTLANGIIYYGTPTGLYAVKAGTGAELWRNTSVFSVYSSPCVISKIGEIFHSSASGIQN